MVTVESLTPVELLRAIQSKEPALTVLDVREPWEVELCALEGAHCIPMGRIPGALDSLDPATPTVVLCHHGMRSMQVARFLAAQGFSQVFNLQGGIDAWALEVDPAMARY